MTLTDECKILDDKIKTNHAQYDLDREAAKDSALSSKELDKYEYLTGEDLGYKPGVAEQAKLEYSPFSKVYNKGFGKEDKREKPLKRLKNIEDENEEQLQVIKIKDRKDLNIKSVTNNFDKKILRTKKIWSPNLKIKKKIDHKWLSFKRDKNLELDFSDYMCLKEFFKSMYYRKMLIEKAEMKQGEFNVVLNVPVVLNFHFIMKSGLKIKTKMKMISDTKMVFLWSNY